MSQAICPDGDRLVPGPRASMGDQPTTTPTLLNAALVDASDYSAWVWVFTANRRARPFLAVKVPFARPVDCHGTHRAIAEPKAISKRSLRTLFCSRYVLNSRVRFHQFGDFAMIQRTKRGYIDKNLVVPLLKEGRLGAIQVKTQAKIGSDEYRTAERVLVALEELAEALTGNSRYFQERLATAEHPAKRK